MGPKKRRQLGIDGTRFLPDMLRKIFWVHLTGDHTDVAIAIGNGMTNYFFGKLVGGGNEDGLLGAKLWMGEEMAFISPCLDDGIERNSG